jgi:hypothetical protein
MPAWCVVALTASVTMLSRLWEGDLAGDQLLYAAVAQGIAERHDWLSLHLGSDPYWKKPPLVFWLVAVANQVLGPTALAARLFPALFGVVSCVALYALARRLFDDTTALLAGLVLATTPLFFTDAAGLSLVPPVVCFTLVAVLFYVRATATGASRDHVVAGASWGAAVLAKSAFGLMAPAVFLTYVATERRWAVLRSRGFMLSLAVAAGVALPWHVHQLVTWGPAFLRVYVGQEVIDRATGRLRLDVHQVSYVWELVRGDWPWIAFVLIGLVVAFRRARSGDRPAQFLLAWTLGYFALLHLVGVRRHQYLLPLFPPLAVVSALGVRRVLPETWIPVLTRAVPATAAAIGLAFNLLPVRRHELRYDPLRALAPVIDELLPPGARLHGHRTSVQLRAASLLYLGRDVEPIKPTAVRPQMVVLTERKLVDGLERAGLRPTFGNERYVLYRAPPTEPTREAVQRMSAGTGGGPAGRFDRMPRGRNALRSSRLRMRTVSGVTSTSSSSSIQASAGSSPMSRCGTSRTASSCPDARMFVSFFSRQTFTSRSTSREYSPTTMPS